MNSNARARLVLLAGVTFHLITACGTSEPGDQKADASASQETDSSIDPKDASDASPNPCTAAAPTTGCHQAAHCPAPASPNLTARCLDNTCTTTPKRWSRTYPHPGADGGDDSDFTLEGWGAPYGHHARYGPGDGHDAALLADGSLAIVGISDFGGSADDADVRLLRVDAAGDVMLDKRLPFLGKTTDAAVCAGPKDTLYVASAVTFEQSARFAQLSSCGEPLWSKQVLPSKPVTSYVDYVRPFHRVERVRAHPKGGVVGVGWHTAVEEGQWGARGWLVHMSDEGKQLVNRSYSGHVFHGPGYTNAALHDLARSPDDQGWLLVGHNEARASCLATFDGWVVRVDDKGKRLWDRFFGREQVDLLHAVAAAPGGYVLVGRTFSWNAPGGDPWLLRMDDSGQHKAPLWQRRLPWSGLDQLADVAVSGKHLYAVGWSETHGASRAGLALKASLDDGEIAWTRVLDQGGRARFDALALRPDGTVVAVGQTRPDPKDLSGSSTSDDLWIHQLDPDGNGEGHCTQPTLCDDGNPCTLDGCDAKTGECAATPLASTGPCDDGQPCTVASHCQQGKCGGGQPRLYATVPLGEGGGEAIGALPWSDGSWFVSGRSPKGQPWLSWRGPDGAPLVADLDPSLLPQDVTQVSGLGALARHGRHEDQFNAVVLRPPGKAPVWQKDGKGPVLGVLVETVRVAVSRQGLRYEKFDARLGIANAKDATLRDIANLPEPQIAVVGHTGTPDAPDTHAFYAIGAGGYTLPATLPDDGGGPSRLVATVRTGPMHAVAAGSKTVANKAQGWLIGFTQKEGAWDAKPLWQLDLPQMAIADAASREASPGKGTTCTQAAALYVAGRSALAGSSALVLTKLDGAGVAASGSVAVPKLLWSMTYPVAQLSRVSAVRFRDTEDLFVAGWRNGAAGKPNSLLTRVSPASGALLALQPLGGPAGSEVAVAELALVGDDLVAVGKQGASRWAARLDRWGNSTCVDACVGAKSCDDGDACTSDTCGVSGCAHSKNLCL